MMEQLASQLSKLLVGDPQKLRKLLHKEHIKYTVKTEMQDCSSGGDWIEWDQDVEIKYDIIKEIPFPYVSHIWNRAQNSSDEQQRVEAMVALALFTSAMNQIRDVFAQHKHPDFYLRTRPSEKSDGYFSIKTTEGEVVYRAFVQKRRQ